MSKTKKLKITIKFCIFEYQILALKSGSHLPKNISVVPFIENPLKMMKNGFYSILKALFVFKIFKFLSWLFGHAKQTA